MNPGERGSPKISITCGDIPASGMVVRVETGSKMAASVIFRPVSVHVSYAMVALRMLISNGEYSDVSFRWKFILSFNGVVRLHMNLGTPDKFCDAA